MDVPGQAKDTTSVNLKTFVSYTQSPEVGTKGILGLALSSYNYNQNFMRKFQRAVTGISTLNYSWYYQKTNSDQIDSLYEGFFALGSAPVAANVTEYFTAGVVNTDEEILALGFNDLDQLFEDGNTTHINPFIEMKLANFTIGQPKI